MPCTMNDVPSKLQNYNGWLIINKPLGITSAHVVSKVKRLLGKNNKIGHAGTLDPLADGILPLAIGEGTKVVQFLLETDKVYEFDVTWGEERSTDDAEGEVVRSSELRVEREEILQAIESFVGNIKQVPPNYSAIKVDGQRSYDLARKNQAPELKAREVTVYELVLNAERSNLNSASFRMHCSKGTYVRSIARDLGRKLGCYGYVSRLHRAGHGVFTINDAISLEQLADLCEKGAVSSCILPLEKVLDGIPALSLDEIQEAKIRNGIAIDNCDNFESETVMLMKNEKLVAIANPQNGKLQPIRVFNH